MDSLTHIVLGAAIGEVTLGKKIGNRAILWGAVLSIIPDLDVFITPFLKPVDALFFHRGISHSILALLILIPITGWLISKIEKKHDIKLNTWYLFTSLPLISHIFIDCFNTYGTGILEPFSNIRVAYDSMAIIDFFFLLPLIFTVIWILFIPYQKNIRRKIAWVGLSIATLYFSFSIFNKIIVENRAKEQLTVQGIKFNRLLTTPAPLSNFFWTLVAENDSGYYISNFSNFDKTKAIKFRFVSSNSYFLIALCDRKDINDIKEILRFTKGFYTVEKDKSENLWIYDLRFASLDIDNEKAYVFSFELKETPWGLEVSRSHPNRRINIKTIKKYFERIF